jgi:hypothetical protein
MRTDPPWAAPSRRMPGTSHAPTQFASPEYLPHKGRVVNCPGLRVWVITYSDAYRANVGSTYLSKGRKQRLTEQTPKQQPRCTRPRPDQADTLRDEVEVDAPAGRRLPQPADLTDQMPRYPATAGPADDDPPALPAVRWAADRHTGSAVSRRRYRHRSASRPAQFTKSLRPGSDRARSRHDGRRMVTHRHQRLRQDGRCNPIKHYARL